MSEFKKIPVEISPVLKTRARMLVKKYFKDRLRYFEIRGTLDQLIASGWTPYEGYQGGSFPYHLELVLKGGRQNDVIEEAYGRTLAEAEQDLFGALERWVPEYISPFGDGE